MINRYPIRYLLDAILKALGDPARRDLLDSLSKRGGQSLNNLEQVLAMSRFGVMKHLKVSEEADLIVTRKDGRFKYHYLNVQPLQDVMDRWAAPHLQRQARTVTELKSKLERDAAMGKPMHYADLSGVRKTRFGMPCGTQMQSSTMTSCTNRPNATATC